MATTIAQLIERVRERLDEPVAAQWTDQMIRRWLNEGNVDLARVTRHFKSTATVPLVAGTAEYTLAEPILAVEHAYYIDTVAGGNRQVPLTAVHWESMDQHWGEHQDWRGAWPQAYTVWGYSPNLKLRVYPVPSITGDTCRLLTAILPATIPDSGSDGTNVDVPPAWVDALADYATYMALRRDRESSVAMAEAVGRYQQTREILQHANDYLAVNRELVPDPRAGYVPWWIAGDDDGGW